MTTKTLKANYDECTTVHTICKNLSKLIPNLPDVVLMFSRKIDVTLSSFEDMIVISIPLTNYRYYLSCNIMYEDTPKLIFTFCVRGKPLHSSFELNVTALNIDIVESVVTNVHLLDFISNSLNEFHFTQNSL